MIASGYFMKDENSRTRLFGIKWTDFIFVNPKFTQYVKFEMIIINLRVKNFMRFHFRPLPTTANICVAKN